MIAAWRVLLMVNLKLHVQEATANGKQRYSHSKRGSESLMRYPTIMVLQLRTYFKVILLFT